VRLVVTRPDRRAGRGRKLTPTPVKQRARERGIEVVEPSRMRDPGLVRRLGDLEPEVMFVTAYGRILPRALLDIPRRGCVNLHASLLPRHRGAAPVQWALIRGDRETGLSLMLMDEGMDTGPLLAQRPVVIAPQDTAADLFCRLERASGPFVERELPRYLAGEIEPVAQDEAHATYAPPLDKSDGHVDWSRPAPEIADLVRGVTPWPGARSWLGGRPLCIQAVRLPTPSDEPPPAAPPGTLFTGSGRMAVRCGEGWLEILCVQPPGGRAMDARDFLCGRDPGPCCVFDPPPDRR
jgi:methionyl-tRNA formyltransferase